MDTHKLNYGCGLDAPEDWLNFDCSPTLLLRKAGLKFLRPVFPRNIKYGNIVRGLPVKSQSVKFLYCSHILEHLALDDFHKALKESRRLLKPDGIFRGVVPDLEYMAKNYQGSHDFMRQSGLGSEKKPSLLRSLLGNSAHLWMWDYKSLEDALHQAGFKHVRRAEYGDCNRSEFRTVENKGRWESCLGFEAH